MNASISNFLPVAVSGSPDPEHTPWYKYFIIALICTLVAEPFAFAIEKAAGHSVPGMVAGFFTALFATYLLLKGRYWPYNKNKNQD